MCVSKIRIELHFLSEPDSMRSQAVERETRIARTAILTTERIVVP